MPTPLSDTALVADLHVELSDALEADRRQQLERVEAPLLLRISALDWFEHEGRFEREGETRLLVEVTGLSLRSVLSTWLWPDLPAPDVLAIRVRVRDPAGTRHAFDWEERTQVGGWEWRDPDVRLERLARRLGRRIAELL